MKKVKLVGGEIVLVPLYDGRYCVTKVLYSSQHANFKNTVLLGVSKDIVNEVRTPLKLPTKFDMQFYTWNDEIRSGLWPVVAKVELSDEDRARATRVHTDKLWFQDELLRVATDDDLKKFPQMETDGTILAEINVREHLGMGESYGDNPNPLYARAYTRRGKALAELGEHAQAIKKLNSAISLDAACKDAYLARAEVHSAMGENKKAEADRKKAAEVK